MIIREVLLRIPEIEQKTSSGWFRSLHDHYQGRYPTYRLGFDSLDPDKVPFKDEPVPAFQLFDAPDAWINAFNHYAWMLGTASLFKTYCHFFDDLDPLARGAFIAAAIEVHFTEEIADFFVRHHQQMQFSPDSFCQIGCYSIRGTLLNDCWQKVFDALMETDQDLTEEIKRQHYTPVGPGRGDDDPLDHLSGRVIDIILEASIFCNSTPNVKQALILGADPNILIWQLERSFNEKHNALSFSLSQGYNDIVVLLLEYGATDNASTLTPKNTALFQAAYMRQDDVVLKLISQGAEIGALEQPPSGRCFFHNRAEKLQKIKDTIGSIIPLANISEKQVFYVGNAQGGSHSSILDIVLRDVDRLKNYEELGLDIRLTPEEICTAITWKSFEGLDYLFSKHGEEARQQAMSKLEELRG